VQLAASPVLAETEDLVLTYNELGDRGAIALAGSPHTRALKRLFLEGNQIGDAGGTALAKRHDICCMELRVNPTGGLTKTALAERPLRCCP